MSWPGRRRTAAEPFDDDSHLLLANQDHPEQERPKYQLKQETRL